MMFLGGRFLGKKSEIYGIERKETLVVAFGPDFIRPLRFKSVLSTCGRALFVSVVM